MAIDVVLLFAHLAILSTAARGTTLDLGHGSSTTLFRAVTVPVYNGVGSMQILDYSVPPLTDVVLLTVAGYRSPSSPLQCPSKDIILYFQLGSIPVSQFENNETFPPQFHIRRDFLSYQLISSNGSRIAIEFQRPVAGVWFMAAFLDKSSDITRVSKLVNTANCVYNLQVNMTVFTLDKLVIDLAVDQDVHVELTSESGVGLFRFFLKGSVVAYTVFLECNGVMSLGCHAMLSARGGGLPINGSSDTSVSDCVDNSILHICMLRVSRPLVEQWQYIEVSPYVGQSIIGKLRVDVQDISQTVAGNQLDPPPIGSVNDQQVMQSSSSTNVQPLTTTKQKININGSFLSKAATESDTSVTKSSVLLNFVSTPTAANLTSEFVNASYTQGTVNVIQKDLSSYGPPTEGVLMMTRVNDEDRLRSTVFSSDGRDSSVTVVVTFGDHRVTLRRFDIDPLRDIGSILKVRVELPEFVGQPDLSTDRLNVTSRICVQKGRLPIGDDGRLVCDHDDDELALTQAHNAAQILYPFPQPGPWFIGIQTVCYQQDGEPRPSCPMPIGVVLNITSAPCIDGCSNSGYCSEYSAGVFTFAACRCSAHYGGFTCEDSSRSSSRAVQLIQTLLLTLSNLGFVASIVVAIRRQRFIEALVYFTNMFFSAFYHACDMSGWSVFVMCIMPYGVLQFSDFFCSLMSFWVTLLATARLPFRWTSFCHMVGVMALSMAVNWNMKGTVTNVVPVACGAAIVIVSWVIQSCKLKKFIPGKRAVLWLLPGVALATVGICLFLFVETNLNYPYTHSAWHICMSISICFLLPRRRISVNEDSVSDTSSVLPLTDFEESDSLIHDD